MENVICYRGTEGDSGGSSGEHSAGGGQVVVHILIGKSQDSWSSWLVVMVSPGTAGSALAHQDITPGHGARLDGGGVSFHHQVNIKNIQVSSGLNNILSLILG